MKYAIITAGVIAVASLSFVSGKDNSALNQLPASKNAGQVPEAAVVEQSVPDNPAVDFSYVLKTGAEEGFSVDSGSLGIHINGIKRHEDKYTVEVNDQGRKYLLKGRRVYSLKGGLRIDEAYKLNNENGSADLKMTQSGEDAYKITGFAGTDKFEGAGQITFKYAKHGISKLSNGQGLSIEMENGKITGTCPNSKESLIALVSLAVFFSEANVYNEKVNMSLTNYDRGFEVQDETLGIFVSGSRFTGRFYEIEMRVDGKDYPLTVETNPNNWYVYTIKDKNSREDTVYLMLSARGKDYAVSGRVKEGEESRSISMTFSKGSEGVDYQVLSAPAFLNIYNDKSISGYVYTKSVSKKALGAAVSLFLSVRKMEKEH